MSLKNVTQGDFEAKPREFLRKNDDSGEAGWEAGIRTRSEAFY
jgi:hypothetical protein